MKKGLGIFIVGIMAALLGSMATTIVSASLKDQHALPRLVAYEVRQVRESNQKKVLGMSDPLKEQSSLLNAASAPSLASEQNQPNCVVRYQSASDSSGNTLAGYLREQGESRSYEHRLQLAAEVGIADYTGTYEQNLHLLTELKKKSDAEQAKCSTSDTNVGLL